MSISKWVNGRRKARAAPSARRLLRPHLLCGVELPVSLFDAASPLVPGNGGADMVWTSPLACSGDLLLRLAACQGKDLMALSQESGSSEGDGQATMSHGSAFV